MNRINVKYLNIYHDLTGKKEETVNLEDYQTLKNLLEKIAKSNSRKFREFIFEENFKLKPHIWLLVNKKREKDLDRKLRDGDKVVFSLTLVGG